MEPTMFVPMAQAGDMAANAAVAVRAAAGTPKNLAHAVANALAQVDPTAIVTVVPLEKQVEDALSQERLVAALASFFGVLGLLLAAVGLYGVTSHAVTSRRGEIGIRMALGASAEGVVRLVLRQTAWLVAIGLAAGAAVTLWATKFVASLLFGLTPRDPATFAAAAGLLIVVAAIAAWLPARRASRIDPMQVLRNS
jgi:ABC-type antimicrobial peptide transport system permease subunit